MPSNGSLCEANLCSNFKITAKLCVAATNSVELPSRFVRLFGEFSSLEE